MHVVGRGRRAGGVPVLHVPVLVLDTSHRALSTKRLAVLRPSQLGGGLALTLLAMGFDEEGFATLTLTP